MTTTCEGNGANTTLTLSGNVSLIGNTEVANGLYTSGESSAPGYSATLDFTGSITYNGYTLTAIPNSSTIVSLPTTAASSKKNPSAPNTGSGLSTNNSIYAAIGTSLIAGTLFVVVIYTKRNKVLCI